MRRKQSSVLRQFGLIGCSDISCYACYHLLLLFYKFPIGLLHCTEKSVAILEFPKGVIATSASCMNISVGAGLHSIHYHIEIQILL